MPERFPTRVPDLTIRCATRGDVPLLISLIRELAVFEELEHAMQADDATLAEELFGSAPAAEALIADLAGEAVGFALFFHNFSTFLGRKGLYLEDLYVKPHARGRGVGRALITFVAKIAVERNCGRFEWSVLDWNTRAVDFYRSLGAVPMEEWTVQRVTGEALERLAAKSLKPGSGP